MVLLIPLSRHFSSSKSTLLQPIMSTNPPPIFGVPSVDDFTSDFGLFGNHIFFWHGQLEEVDIRKVPFWNSLGYCPCEGSLVPYIWNLK